MTDIVCPTCGVPTTLVCGDPAQCVECWLAALPARKTPTGTIDLTRGLFGHDQHVRPLCQCHPNTPGGWALHHLDNIGRHARA